MADDTSRSRTPYAFWTSVPRMLTAVAGLLTAVAALFGVLLAAGVIRPSSPVQGTSRDASPDLPTPSWEDADRQGTLVVRNAELASLDSGASGGSTGDFQLVVDKETGKASISVLFSTVYLAPVTGTPDAAACASALGSQRRQSIELNPEVGKWICVSTYEEHVGAIETVTIVAKEQEATFNFVLWTRATPS